MHVRLAREALAEARARDLPRRTGSLPRGAHSMDRVAASFVRYQFFVRLLNGVKRVIYTLQMVKIVLW